MNVDNYHNNNYYRGNKSHYKQKQDIFVKKRYLDSNNNFYL